MTFFGRAEFEAARDKVRAHTDKTPTIGIVLGSGLGAFAESVTNADIIDTGVIPHWPGSTVEGHAGRLLFGTLEGETVMVLQGRSHFYEGHPISQITLPIRVMQLLGVQTVILTNAAGGLNASFEAGDLMIIADHINLIGMTGVNPLIGPNDPELGPRFPSLTRVYTKALRDVAHAGAAEHAIPIHQGVYAGLSGPTFETPAEIRFLRTIGADAVGMSTVAEATVAAHGGLNVLGISGITNIAIDDPNSPHEPNHEEVLEAGKIIAPRLQTVLRYVLRHFPTL